MDGRLDIPSCQEAERVARVNSQAPVERFGPLPIACRVVLDLEPCHGLAEQQRDRAQVRMTVGSDTTGFERLELLLRIGRVLHVPQMRLVVDIPPVHVHKEILGKLQRQSDQAVQRV